MPDPMPPEVKKRLIKTTAHVRHKTRKYVPPGFRLPIGLVLMAGGVVGFLPILGFWMIPVGFAVAALDARPAWRYLTGRKRGGGHKR
ncbi:hypothetical protein [Silicimonas sp. MF1-12-2]|jgi:hypothetical protein|uniref:hypothetical protein n=1 Tax=Silicimonas sp. MF1-12-2 TaxID=3384793 RepID=UPI0039B5E77F